MIIYSQTAVKDLEREETCPFRWKSKWIDKNPDLQISNEATEKGKYFEQAILGSSAHDSNVVELPKLKNGMPSTDELRIQNQIAKITDFLLGNNPLNIGLYKSQLSLKYQDESGVIDCVLTDKLIKEHWVVDLKLTKDLTSTRTAYGFGNDWSEMDQLQLAHYGYLYYKKYNIAPRLALLVADYSPQERVEFGEIILSQKKMEERALRFAAVKGAVNLYEKYGWIKIPSQNECKNCTLICESRFKQNDTI